MLFATQGLQSGVGGQQLFFGFGVSSEFAQTSAQVAAAALDHPVLQTERFLVDGDCLPLQLFGLGILPLVVKQAREIVQTRTYVTMIFPQRFALYAERLPLQG